jgi:hypothetical protein
MRRRRRLALVGLAAAATASAVAAGLLTAPTSHADVAGPFFATQGNASDPHIIRCTRSSTPLGTYETGYCLYASRDMGAAYRYEDNWYPMEQTMMYFSMDGKNWSSGTEVAHENTFEAAGWVPTNAYHQWAPSAVEVKPFPAFAGEVYLYVPNVSDKRPSGPAGSYPTPNISTSSRIGVFKAPQGKPQGPYTYLGTVPHNYGYMSDPDVVMAGNNSPVLIWADGDFSTCGGFQSVVLQNDMITPAEHSRQFISITGIEELGTCVRETDGVNVGRPYMEGASLYGSGTNWSIVFAAKPSVMPKECHSGVTPPGSANTLNEVIAWARSTTGPQGTYTYQGVLICGSTTEWTNQATLATINGENAKPRSVIIYHDSPADIKERKLHVECRFTNADGSVVAGVFRQAVNAPNGYNDCLANKNSSFYGWRMRQPQYPNYSPIIQAPSNGSALIANRWAVGPWERYKKHRADGAYGNIEALSNGKMLCTPNATTPITASCDYDDVEDDPNARWKYVTFPGHNYKLLYHEGTGRYAAVGVNGLLYASAVLPENAAQLTHLYMGGNPN